MKKPSAPSVIRQTGSTLTIGNACLERVLSIKNRRLRTVAFRNRLTGRLFRVEGDEFRLAMAGRAPDLTVHDFMVESVQPRKLRGAGARLEIRLTSAKPALTVTLFYEVKRDEPVLRKWLVIETNGALLRRLAVETFVLKDHAFSFGGFGQPLFVDRELFFGLEYPAGYNTGKKDGSVLLHHYPGRTGPVESKTAVFGVAADRENERVRDAFDRYVNANRARPVRFFSQLGEVAWRHPARRAIEAMSCREVFQGARDAFIRRGIRLDSVYFHGDRQTFNPQSLLGELPARRQKPFTLKQRVKWAHQLLDANVVMHLNAGGGRSSGDQAWFVQHFDMINTRYYCMADPRVIGQMTSNLLALVKKYNLAGLSFDWLWWIRAWECGARDHRGHIAGRKYGREAITDRFIEMCQTLRQAKPDIVFEDLEVELSPWWLFHADALWSYAGEGDKIPFEEIDGAVRHWTRQHVVFPLSSIWYATPEPEVPFGRNYPDEHMLHYVLLHYLRGGQMEEFYFNFSKLSPETLDRIAAVIKWARAREEILLANSTPVLGDPFKQRTYGYTHFRSDNRGVIGLRNPAAWRNEPVRLRLDEEAHFYKDGKPVRIEVVYPYRRKLDGLFAYGDTLDTTIPGDEVVVLETFPTGRSAPASARDRRVKKPDGRFSPRPVFQVQFRNRKVSAVLEADVPADERWEWVVSVEVTLRQRTSLAEQMRITNRRLALQPDASLRQAGGIEIEEVSNPFAENAARFVEAAPKAFAADLELNGKPAEFERELFTRPSHQVDESGMLQPTQAPSGIGRIQKVGPHPHHTNVAAVPLRYRLQLEGKVRAAFILRVSPAVLKGLPSFATFSAHINRAAPCEGDTGTETLMPGALPIRPAAETRSTITLQKPVTILNIGPSRTSPDGKQEERE